MVRKRMAFLVALVLLTTATPALADGVILNGLYARSIGRGGTNIAFADNGGVLSDNPAGAVNIPGQGMLDIGVDGMLTHFEYSEAFAGSASDTSITPLPQIALIRKSADGQWAYGIGLLVPAGFTEGFNMEGPFPLLGPRYYKSFGSLAKVLPGISFRLNERLSVGGTLGVGISHDELEGPYFLQGPRSLPGTPTMLDLQGTGAALVWSLGFQYALSEATTLGIAYQSESRFQLRGSARVEVPLLGESRYDSQTDITWPRSVGFGVRHALCQHRILSADVIWYNWSKAFDDFGINLTNPSNPFFPAVYEQLPLHWRDTVSVRLGYERVFEGGRVLRFGYVHHRNPIPDATLTPFIQAIFEHAFSLGYGWEWQSWNLDLAYMYSFGAAQRVGTSSLIGGDFNDSTHRAQAHAISVDLTHRF